MLLDWTRPELWRPWIETESVRPCGVADTAAQLRARFAAVRSFHAARPTDIASYYRHGIRPLTKAGWSELVDEALLSLIDDHAIIAAVIRARDVQFALVSEGRVHFCCDRRLLQERDGYSLLFGSLSLLAVAIQIDKEFGTDLKGALRRRGEPTVFVCDVPTAVIDDDTLAALTAGLRKPKATAPLFDFHFAIPGALPPAAIVGHYRPERVIDAVYGQHIGCGEAAAAGAAIARLTSGLRHSKN